MRRTAVDALQQVAAAGHWRRSVAGAASVLLLAAGAGLLMLSLLQNRLLYYPAAAGVEQMLSGRLSAWPSRDDFRGLLAEPPAPPRATAIVFHGNAGHAGHRAWYAEALEPLGFRVILAEYPGYGPRGGALGEASLVADAAESIDLAHRRYGSPLIVVGESLGAAVAAAAASRRREVVAGLLLITPWDRLAHIAAHHYPFLPVKWLLKDGYESGAHLAGFGRPVVVAIADDDAVVPPRFGLALHESLDAPKRLLRIAGGAHNDWMARVDADWWRRVTDFLLAERS